MLASALLVSAWITARIAAGLGLLLWGVGVATGLGRGTRTGGDRTRARTEALAQVGALVTGGALVALTRGEAERAWPAAQAGIAALAAVLGPLGGMLGAWSVRALAHGDGLVTTGPFGIVRHPLYLSLLLVTGAAGLALGSIVGTAALVGMLYAVSAWRARAEDATLARDHGAAWTAWSGRVHGFRPRV